MQEMSNRLLLQKISSDLEDQYKSEIIAPVIKLLNSMLVGDTDVFDQCLHNEARRIGLGNENKIYIVTKDQINTGLKQLSQKIAELDTKFQIDQITHVHIKDVTASVEIEWRMIWDGGEGKHWSCFHLVKQNGVWFIVNHLDRGIEINDDYKDFSFGKIKSENEEEKIIQIRGIIDDYFVSHQDTDVKLFTSIWHNQAKRFNLGNSNELLVLTEQEIIEQTIDGLRIAREQINGFDVQHEINEISHIEVGDVTATAEVEWKMLMPDTSGSHRTYFHLAKEDTWQIVGLLDRGIEI
jgi:hypothetical protein